MTIPNAFYRISVKALVLNDEGEFLLSQRKWGAWDFLGGGLDHKETSSEGLRREILEETGLTTTYISERPEYFFTIHDKSQDRWMAIVLFRTELEDLNFTSSEECIALRYFSVDELSDVETIPNVAKFVELFAKR